jgi:hypothetical protein
MIKRTYAVTTLVLWAALLVLMPITSMPLVAKLVSPGTTVASPAGLFLMVLMVIWFIPTILRGKSLPIMVVPLAVFAITALMITTASIFMLDPPYKVNNPLKESFEAILTLGIGVSFYLLTTLWLTDIKKMTLSLQLINWSGVIILIWVGVQAVSWFIFNRYPDWVRSIHELYSVGPLFRQRVSGFALEPSWFAHQLNMLYLPLWLALSINRVSVHRLRLMGLTLENILLAAGVVAMFLSYSRVGLAAFLMMVGYYLIRVNLYLIGKIQSGILLNRFKKLDQVNPRVISIGLGMAMGLGYTLVIIALAFTLSRIDPRMAKLFDFNINHPDGILYYANDLTFASRLVYWQAGWNVFNQYPLFGVGLGKVGFYLNQNLSPFAWRLVEVRDLAFRSTSALNIKSLWVRLLAETGIVGFSIFVSWLWGLWQTSKIVENSTQPVMKSISWLGKFVIIGFILEGFSVDTFALPYFWVSLGILTASYGILKNKNATLEKLTN